MHCKHANLFNETVRIILSDQSSKFFEYGTGERRGEVEREGLVQGIRQVLETTDGVKSRLK